ncbi:MAG: DUF1566 domain-containing protein [Smithellaceae bacterium]
MKDSLVTMVVIFVLAVFMGNLNTTTAFAAVEIGRDGRFIAYDNGTVLDTQTNLMWAAKDNGSDVTRQSAEEYCQYYRGGGYADWRMPRQDELAGLYDETKTYKSDCNYDVHLTELIHLTSPDPWAAETTGFKAVYFSYVIGKGFWYTLSGINLFRALPVRSAK